MNSLFDFSTVQAGDILIRMIHNLSVQHARVIAVTDTVIECDVLHANVMGFDRHTGVECRDVKFGILLNTSGSGSAFVNSLKAQLCEAMADEKSDLKPETFAALRHHLTQLEW